MPLRTSYLGRSQLCSAFAPDSSSQCSESTCGVGGGTQGCFVSTRRNKPFPVSLLFLASLSTPLVIFSTHCFFFFFEKCSLSAPGSTVFLHILPTLGCLVTVSDTPLGALLTLAMVTSSQLQLTHPRNLVLSGHSHPHVCASLNTGLRLEPVFHDSCWRLCLGGQTRHLGSGVTSGMGLRFQMRLDCHQHGLLMLELQ